jgi:adenine-specific DNA-methyltransferase
LCTNNENNIASEVTYPRIKKVIEGVDTLPDITGIPANLKYFKTSFVPAGNTDKNKTQLTKKATSMLCIKEGTFESVKENERYQIFRKKNKYTGIIFDPQAIDEFKEQITDLDGKFSVYVFSLSDDTFDDEFESVKEKVNVSPIPEAILRVYRRIFK